MKKLLLVLIAFACPSLNAIKPLFVLKPGDIMIDLKLGNEVYPVPEPILNQLATLKYLKEELQTDEIEITAQITPKIMDYLSKIMWALYNNQNLRDRALLDALDAAVTIDQASLIDLLKAFNYFDFPVGMHLIARKIASDKTIRSQFIADKSMRDLKPLIAHYYYLLHNADLAGVDVNSYGFSIQDYIDYQPAKVETSFNILSLNSARINSLYGLGRVPGAKDLEEILLINNQIRELPADAFRGMKNLKQLYLNNNQIETLPESVFEGLDSLEELDLRKNRLKELPEDLLRGTPHLNKLVLSLNQITTLPSNIFHSLEFLRELHISGNQLEELPQNLFEGLGSLQVINLDNNRLKELPLGIFENLTNLQQISLIGNRIDKENQEKIRLLVPGVHISFD